MLQWIPTDSYGFQGQSNRRYISEVSSKRKILALSQWWEKQIVLFWIRSRRRTEIKTKNTAEGFKDHAKIFTGIQILRKNRLEYK